MLGGTFDVLATGGRAAMIVIVKRKECLISELRRRCQTRCARRGRQRAY
jgi:hypothetical protein